MLKEGDPAPQFKVLTDTGEEFDLADHKDEKIVLYFYPRGIRRAARKSPASFATPLKNSRRRASPCWESLPTPRRRRRSSRRNSISISPCSRTTAKRSPTSMA